MDKAYDPKAAQQRYYSKWQNEGCFKSDANRNADPFTVMMPPPNVTGSLHMGHALNMTLQDILTRWNRMRGKDALWQPGTDHAGIATQMVVERKLEAEGVSRHDLGRDEFIDKVWEWKEESGGTIVSQLKQLGASPDWDRERFTMDEGLSKAVRKVFVQLYKEGLIYKDKRLVNWDPKLQTSISDLEVESKEQKGKMWHIRYPVEGDVEQFITVATTRPETMLGDTAVAVHPDDERYRELVGKSVSLPIVGRLIPIVADEYSDPEKGSGAVKITPAHDFNDFEVGKRHDLPMISVFDSHAKIVEDDSIPKQYHGLDRFEARKAVLAELEELDLLVDVEDIKNAVPYGDRSGVVIEPFLTDQWYCDAPTLAKPAIEAVKNGKTEFVPKQWENTYFAWMENIQPWCISRQLWWGHQIPAWIGPDGKVFVAETEDEAKAEAFEFYKEEVSLTQDPDVLDTWFSSALWPFSTLGWPDQTPELNKYYPGDVLITGFDIIFFWVARMMMMGIHFMGDVPFKTVYMHALVRDSKGQKMSKSKGNVIDPLELIDQYGADALRFTLTAMAAQGRDIKLSEDRVEGYRNFTTKLWNAAIYCDMNGCVPADDFNPATVQSPLNQFIIGQLRQAQIKIDTALEQYRFNEAANALYQFSWGTFCDWYLEFTKPILSEDHAAQKETKEVAGWVLDQIVLLMAPFMPYLAEELYRRIDGREGQLVAKMDWPDYADGLSFSDAEKELGWVQSMISEIRSVRADMNVPAGAKIVCHIKDASAQTKQWLTRHEEIIKRMARLETIDHVNEIAKGAIQTVVGEATLILPIADIIDLDAERDRLRKVIAGLEKDIQHFDKKLANPKFIENAAEDIIAEQREKMKEAETALQKYTQALQQLDAA